MYKNLLPIGSVVLLKGGQKRVMIIGRVQARAGEDKIYDYSACMYPEGMIGGETTCFFDRDAVDTVYFIGFQDPDEMKFRHHVLDQLGELEIKDGKIVPKQ